MSNPFKLVTASKLSASEAVELWCDDRRIDRVKGNESCFINGHRGTGKSMLFRILQYDCQKLLQPTVEPSFLSIYFAVRDSELMTEELELFQDDSLKYILSESHFAVLLLRQFFYVVKSNLHLVPNELHNPFTELLSMQMNIAYQFCSHTPIRLTGSFDEINTKMIYQLEIERQRIVSYIGLRTYRNTSFDGPLFLFDTLLRPIAEFLKRETNKILYVFIDDGDDLPLSHTVVLNTWIARRSEEIVFKVSTMFGYKTYQTRGRSAIQHPHDFIQYDIATRYLSDKSEDYIDLLRDITQKRLRLLGIDTTAEYYFPEDDVQNAQVKQLEAELMKEYSIKYSTRPDPSRTVRDYVYRHLTSEYHKRVLKPGHSVGSYKYCGFRILATLSSGMVRDYIICAQKMFENASRFSNKPNYIPLFIPPSIQNQVVKQHADELLDEISDPKQKRRSSTPSEWLEVKRLIEGLANTFKSKMFSDDSERRVFSFAFQDEPSPNIERLLDLAISEGYLMRGFISRKEGTGRRVLYVLTRRLAPAFSLDVSSYSGYLSMTSDRVQNFINSGAQKLFNQSSSQLTMFADVEFIADPPVDVYADGKQWQFISPEEAGL